MSVAVTCPQCGAHGKAHDDKIGKRVKCAKCGSPVSVGPSALPLAAMPNVQGEPPDRMALDAGPGRWDDPTDRSDNWRAERARAAVGSGRRRQILIGIASVVGIILMLVLGEMFASQVRARRQLEAEAERGKKDALFALAMEYDTGTGRRRDVAKAWDLFREAAKRGSPDAQFFVAQRHERGRGVKVNLDAAVVWYHRAVKTGHAQALDRYRAIAEAGHVEAQWGLAQMYMEGGGVAQDTQEAVRWYTKAAEAGRLEAQYTLAGIYAAGADVRRDAPKALQWYAKAGDRGHAASAHATAVMYERGDGTAPSMHTAVTWYTKAAGLGHAAAQYRLGLMHYEGDGVPKDYHAAHDYFALAAGRDHADAAYRLAGLYFSGRSKEGRSLYFALKWFKEAGDLGHARAQYAAGVMLHNRLGQIPKDRLDMTWHPQDAGEYWLDKAFATGGWKPVPVYSDPNVLYVTNPERDDKTFLFTPDLGLVVRNKRLRAKFPPPG